MKVEGAIHRQFSQLYKGLEQQAAGLRRFGGLVLGEQDAGEEEERGEGVFHDGIIRQETGGDEFGAH